jgi:hypothetical protein
VIRRDVLTGAPARGADAPRGRPEGKDLHIELEAADHEEPTWEVHRPGAPRRRFDRRARMILTVAAVAAVLANAGAAWAYWRWNGPEASQPAAGAAAFELALSGSTGPEQKLRPGETSDLTVTVTNQHAVPLRITSIRRGAGPVAVDEAHRGSGCAEAPVEMAQESFAVSWEVPKNTIGAFVLEDAVTVRDGLPAACRTADLVVPVQARAERP